MAKHIHIHVGTRDGTFNEADHPRKDNGQFGTGAGAKTGKSDYAKQRESDYDNKRDAEYATRRAEQEATSKKLDGDAKAKAEAMNPAQRAQRLTILRTKLNHMSDGAPLREKVAITREMRAIETAQKGESTPAPKKDEPAKKPDPKATPAKTGATGGKKPAPSGNANEAAQAVAFARKLSQEVDPDDRK